jgi:hypothetical protein
VRIARDARRSASLFFPGISGAVGDPNPLFAIGPRGHGHMGSKRREADVEKT